jgi:hypothetical protein
MTDRKSYLHTIQQKNDYQLLIRDKSDNAAQGLLTLLVTINVGAFVTIIELLGDHYWLLILFSISTISALLARTGIYYIYRFEVNMFDNPENKAWVESAQKKRMFSWRITEYLAWLSLFSIITGILLLTILYIVDYGM